MIATGVTVPFVVVAAFAIAAISGKTGGSPTPSSSAELAPITTAAPPHGAAQTVSCTKLIATLPISLDGLPQRVVHTEPASVFVFAWGQPAVLLSCGAARPKDLQPGSSAPLQEVDGVPFEFTIGRTPAVYTAIDRAPYISIVFPAGRQPADYLPTLARAIATALPAVCSTDDTIADPSKLCDRRP